MNLVFQFGVFFNFQIFQSGTTMAAQPTKLMEPTPTCICIQLPSTVIHSVVEPPSWFFAKPTPTMANQLAPTVVTSAWKLPKNARLRLHGSELSKNTPCWTSMADHWAGQRTVSRDHKGRTTAASVPTKYTVVTSLKLITALPCTLAWSSAAPTPKSCQLNGNTKLVHALASQSLMTCGFRVIYSIGLLKSLAWVTCSLLISIPHFSRELPLYRSWPPLTQSRWLVTGTGLAPIATCLQK